MGIMGIIWTVIVGLSLASGRWFYPGTIPMAWWLTALIGVAGSIIGGFISSLIWKSPDCRFHPALDLSIRRRDDPLWGYINPREFIFPCTSRNTTRAQHPWMDGIEFIEFATSQPKRWVRCCNRSGSCRRKASIARSHAVAAGIDDLIVNAHPDVLPGFRARRHAGNFGPSRPCSRLPTLRGAARSNSARGKCRARLRRWSSTFRIHVVATASSTSSTGTHDFSIYDVDFVALPE